ncbi:MAG: hypothetical protein ACM3SY_20955 [Candidatus Omnitrophota bacterium]
MRKAWVFVMFVFVFGFIFVAAGSIGCPLWAERPTKGLFPRKDYVAECSKSFFKKVNANLPLISKVEFFIRTETYYSAYLELALFVSKNEYMNQWIPEVEKEFPSLVEAFAIQKKEFQIENYKDFQTKLGVDDLTYYVLTLHALSEDFRNNLLSGDEAFRLWHMVLAMTERAYKAGGLSEENGAILKVSSHLVFFKDYQKWGKRANRVSTKSTKSTQSTKTDAPTGPLKWF